MKKSSVLGRARSEPFSKPRARAADWKKSVRLKKKGGGQRRLGHFAFGAQGKLLRFALGATDRPGRLSAAKKARVGRVREANQQPSLRGARLATISNRNMASFGL